MVISLLSLGCPKNLADSETLLRKLRARGVGLTGDPSHADVMLVNTCGFVEDAKRESIGEILALAGRKEEGKRLLVLGCLGKRYREELLREIPEIDAVFGVGEEDRIVSYLDGTGRTPQKGLELAPLMEEHRITAPLKVAEGCNRRCTFCVIPSVRGPFTSRSPEDILGEAEAYAKAGVRELMLVAQDLTAYSWRGYGLPSLIRDMASISGDFWIRPLYLHPAGIDGALLRAMAEERKVAPYVDMPLQHSEDRVLWAMGRAGTREGYLVLIREVRQALPGAALRTAFIAGFPGETEEDFSGLLAFVEEAEFDRLGVFTYSKEEGTKAAEMKGHLPKKVKEQRHEAIMGLQAGISLRKNEALEGRRARALVETVQGDTGVARLAIQAREIDGITLIKGMEGRGIKEGDFVDVEITAASHYDLEARCV